MISTVIQNWMQQSGMKSTLSIASTLVCLQVCRFESMEAADRRAFDFHEPTVTLPVFIDDCSIHMAMIPTIYDHWSCDVFR